MRILLVSEDIGCNRYGVGRVVNSLAHNLRGDTVFSVATNTVGDLDSSLDVKIIPFLKIYPKIRYHPYIYRYIDNLIKEFSPNLMHVHGIFGFLQKSAIKCAKRNEIPIILTPHGMLEKWIWRQKGVLYYILKRVYWNILLKPVLKQANCIHAITPQESDTLAREFPNVPQISITNAIDLDEYPRNQVPPNCYRYFLFLGRLHPKKGVDLLIEAFEKSNIEECRLIIAGPDYDVVYSARLREQIRQLDLNTKVTFVGPVYGQQKIKLLQQAWCVVVPSYSDVVALVNLEAAACYIPTITTTMTGLNDWGNSGGFLIEPNLVDLSNALSVVENWSFKERMLLGRKSRTFIERHYSWDVICDQWVKSYQKIASQGGKL